MRPRSVPILRGALLAIVATVMLSVVWTFRHPASSPSPSPSASPSDPGSAAGTRTENLVFTSFKGDRQSYRLTAREMVGQEQEELRLRSVDFAFSYTSRGQPGTGAITADECVYTPAVKKAVFQGHVHLKTADGFELTTDSLTYRGDKNLVRTESSVEFSRKDVSGRSSGLVYQADEGKLELPADVQVRVADEDSPATEIHSHRAVLVREEKTLRFTGGVVATQGGDVLKAERFELDFGDDHVIYRARAVEKVDLRTTAGSFPGAVASPGARGPKHLTCRKLDLWFDPSGALREATAGPGADLTLLPPPKEGGERRRLRAKFITFRFDGQGRLEELRTFKDTTFAATPVPPARGEPSTVGCFGLLAKIDPASGEPQVIAFGKDVVFVQGKRRATAQKAYYDGTLSALFLIEGPELLDEGEGSHLKAQAIDLDLRPGDVAARGDVRHVLEGRAGTQKGFLRGGDEPILATSRFFDYAAKTQTAVYRENALLRSGKDEIRAGELRIRETDGKRYVEANGGVVSLLHPRREERAGKADLPMEARAREMVYDEDRRRVVYRGEVAIRQGDVSVRSPEATLTLTSDGGGVESLRAGEPVEVQEGARRATAAWGTYTPDSETMVLVGEKVILKGPGQEIEGRSLTLHLGDERILVDGQEEVRTQTIIRNRREPIKP